MIDGSLPMACCADPRMVFPGRSICTGSPRMNMLSSSSVPWQGKESYNRLTQSAQFRISTVHSCRRVPRCGEVSLGTANIEEGGCE